MDYPLEHDKAASHAGTRAAKEHRTHGVTWILDAARLVTPLMGTLGFQVHTSYLLWGLQCVLDIAGMNVYMYE